MTTYISILRGINVGGFRMIKMEALRQIFADLGFLNCQTYIQSGNVIFQSNKIDLKTLEKKITAAIIEKFSFEVPVIILELDELMQIIANNTFLNDITKDIAHLHVTFLSEKPEGVNVSKIITVDYQPDEFQLINKAIYLYCPASYSKSKLTNGFFENKLKVKATTRNWRTTNELVSIADKINKL